MARGFAGLFLPAVSILVFGVLLASAIPGVSSDHTSPVSPAFRAPVTGVHLATLGAPSPRALVVPRSSMALTSVSGRESVRPSAGTPSSDIVEVPPPATPPTQPTTFVVASHLACPPACTPSMNVTPPPGPWALILLNFTGSVVPSVYDSSYHASVNGVPVLFGTARNSTPGRCGRT